MGIRNWLTLLILLLAIWGCQQSPVSSDQPQTDQTPSKADRACDSACERRALVNSEIETRNRHLSDDVRAEKFCKLAQSPFSFYRGTSFLFWRDFATDARIKQFGGPETVTWITADAHLENIGSFDNDHGTIVYDLNDFDSAVITDYQFDIWRMATSIILLGRQLSTFDDKQLDDIVDAMSEAYLDAIEDYRGNGSENKLRFDRDHVTKATGRFLVETADSESRRKLLEKWTTLVNSKRIFATNNEKLVDITEQKRLALDTAFASYLKTLSGSLSGEATYFAIKDIKRRIRVGTGSYGNPRYYVLIEGQSSALDDDRILDIKWQGPAPALDFLGDKSTRIFEDSQINNAQRGIIAQKALATRVDDHLGWLVLADGPYTVREKSPYAERFPSDDLADFSTFEAVAKQWGIILAAAHSRADRDYDQQWIEHDFDNAVYTLIDGEHRAFRKLVRQVATEYANQVATDYRAFVATLNPVCE